VHPRVPLHVQKPPSVATALESPALSFLAARGAPRGAPATVTGTSS
jgi:hypothetical protein